MQVQVRPQLLRWARERAALPQDQLARRLNVRADRLREWERTGELSLSLLERLADKTHVPLGYLFLPEPPEEKLPVPDFRTVREGQPPHPSAELLDTISLCERRQAWYRAYLIQEGASPLSFVGAANPQTDPDSVAGSIRESIGLDIDRRASLPTWEDAVRDMIDLVDSTGVLVMRNGVVGNNTHRKLSVTEFRGFVLIDDYAPLIFINGADAKSAQMFTLAHELVHVWLGQSAVSDVDITASNPIERYCNQVAAEVLIPRADFVQRWNANEDRLAEIRRLARHYKVSSLTVIIRAREAGLIDLAEFGRLFDVERNSARETASSGGGDFYRTQRSRIGRRFGRAVIASALEGQTLYRDALDLLGLKKMETFRELARALEVIGE